MGLAARRAGGVVNVARDGGVHAITLDAVAAARVRRCGVGTSWSRWLLGMAALRGVSGAPRGLRIPPRHLARAGMLPAKYWESRRSELRPPEWCTDRPGDGRGV